MADLTITVDVRDGQTMSSYQLPHNGKLTFFNASKTDELKVWPKNAGDMPFCANDKVTAIPQIAVPPQDQQSVRICSAFGSEEFLYSAQIGTAAPEDPIVILETDKVVTPGILYLVGGLVVGIAIGYVIAASTLARRSRATS